MGCQQIAVQIDFGLLIYGAKVKKQVHSLCQSVVIDLYVSAIPEIFVRLQLPVDAGQGRFRGEGDKNLAVIGLWRLLILGEGIVPITI